MKKLETENKHINKEIDDLTKKLATLAQEVPGGAGPGWSEVGVAW